MNRGAQTTLAMNITLIDAAAPVLIALGALLWLDERFSWRQAAGVLIVMAGVSMWWSKNSGCRCARWLAGDGRIVLCMVAWAAYALLLKKWPAL